MIFLWYSDSKELYAENFHFHTSRVYSVSWNKSDTILVSTGLDNQAIAWDVKEKKRILNFPVLDSDLALTSCFYGEERVFVVGGHNCSPRVIPIDQ